MALGNGQQKRSQPGGCYLFWNVSFDRGGRDRFAKQLVAGTNRAGQTGVVVTVFFVP